VRRFRPAEVRWGQEHEEWFVLAGIPIHWAQKDLSRKKALYEINQGYVQHMHYTCLTNLLTQKREYDEEVNRDRLLEIIRAARKTLPKVEINRGSNNFWVTYKQVVPYYTEWGAEQTIFIDDATHGEMIGSIVCI